MRNRILHTITYLLGAIAMSKTRRRGIKTPESFTKISDYLQKIAQLETKIYDLEREIVKLKKKLEEKGIELKKHKKKPEKQIDVKRLTIDKFKNLYGSTKKGEL